MTRPGIEPRSPGPLANTLTAKPMSGHKMEYIILKICFIFCMTFNQSSTMAQEGEIYILVESWPFNQ